MIRMLLGSVLLLACSAAAQTNASYGETHRLKVTVEGERRKVGFFLPKNLGKKAFIPVVVALPDGSGSGGKAFKELGQWELFAFENRFAVLSVDILTSNSEGWHPNDAIQMERDVKAVTEAMRAAEKKAAELGVGLDLSISAIRGHSGACYLALFAGLRHPDMFVVVALNGVPNWFPSFLEFEGEKELGQRIHVYRGESDFASVRKGTDTAIAELKKTGYKFISTEEVKGMRHETRPEVFVKWYAALLRSTAKGRKAAGKIRADADNLRADWKAGKAGVYGKMVKLVEKERKAGFGKAAARLLADASADAAKALKEADDMVADNQFLQAAEALKLIEKNFRGLPAAKTARDHRSKLVKGKEYKAAEMLAEALALQEKGKDEQADAILVKITEKYKETVAARTRGATPRIRVAAVRSAVEA